MASEQIRNRATIGGNIGNASPAGDTITPLIVLGAEIEIFSPESNQHRIISIDELFCGPCATTPEKKVRSSRKLLFLFSWTILLFTTSERSGREMR